MKSFGAVLSLTAVLCGSAFAVARAKQSEPLTEVKISAPAKAKAGKSFTITVNFEVPEGYHLYSPNFKGDTGVPISISSADLPTGLTFKAIKAPKGDLLIGHVVLQVPVSVAATAKGKQSFKLKVRYQQCNDRVCLPPQNAIKLLTTTVS